LKKFFLLLSLVSFFCLNANAQKEEKKLPATKTSVVDNLNVSGNFFIASTYYENTGTKYFGFNIRRSYINIKYKFTDKLDFRYTQDLTIDNEGKDAGNIELRIKYLYLRYRLPGLFFFRDNSIKFGISQRPWLDFEEHINFYRVQGSMFLERSLLFNSSGFGLSFESLLGGKLDNAYAEKVKPKAPGKYGSLAMGLYNGGGYHQFEKNRVKNFEVRVTVRPLYNLLPQLQFSYYTTDKIGRDLMGTFMGEKADGIFLVVDVTIENIGKESKTIWASNIKVVDDQKRTFEHDTAAEFYLENDQKFIFEQLQPGLPKTGKIVFDVPKDIRGVLQISADSMWSDEVKYISLNKKE